MNKEEIERIALEVADSITAPFISDESMTRFAHRFLARIDAERGKDATAWRILDKSGETLRLSESSADVRFCQAEVFPNVPLFLSPTPTIPEGMALVPIEPTEAMVLAGTNEPLVDTGKGEFDEPEDYVAVWKAMLSAAQGKRK